MPRPFLLGATVLLALLGLWKGVPAATGLIHADSCLDHGGRLDRTGRCEVGPASPPASKARASHGGRPSRDTITVAGPTVVAYFPVTQAEVDADGDVMEALSDFQYSLPAIERGLAACGVRAFETYASPVLLKRGQAVETFVPRELEVTVGYRMMSPGRPDRTLEGVDTEVDLLTAAVAYFELPDDCWHADRPPA